MSASDFQSATDTKIPDGQNGIFSDPNYAESDYQKDLNQANASFSAPATPPMNGNPNQGQPIRTGGPNQNASPYQPQVQPQRGQALPPDQYAAAVRRDQINYGLRTPGSGATPENMAATQKNDYQAQLAYLRGQVGKMGGTVAERKLQTKIQQAQAGAGEAPQVPLNKEQQKARAQADLDAQKHGYRMDENAQKGQTQRDIATMGHEDRQAVLAEHKAEFDTTQANVDRRLEESGKQPGTEAWKTARREAVIEEGEKIEATGDEIGRAHV